MEFSADDHV